MSNYYNWIASGKSFRRPRRGFSWQTSRRDRQCENHCYTNGVNVGCYRVISKGEDYFRDGDRILCEKCAEEQLGATLSNLFKERKIKP